MIHPSDIENYLRSSPDLNALCTQNGWIDNDTLRFEVLDATRERTLVAVQFEEIIMEGAGCVAGRIHCYGRVHLNTDRGDRILGLKIVDGLAKPAGES